MSEFFAKQFYGNTVLDWAIAIGIALGAVILGKILYFICSGVLRRVTANTRTKLDDIFLDMIEEPLVVATTVAGVWFGLSQLTLPASAEHWLSRGLQIVIMVCVVWLVSRLLDSLFKEYLAPLAEKSENDLDDQLLPIVRKGTKVMVWSIGIIVALNNAGYDVGALIAGLGIGGLALAMAAKDTVSNIFGGFTIFTDRPFTIHDRVKVAGYDGIIKEIGVRSTRLQTLEGRMVTIPNSKFSDSAVENVSLEPSRKVATNLGLVYDTSPDGLRRAMEILRGIHGDNEHLEEDVVVGFNEWGESAMNIAFIYWIRKDHDIMETQTEINLTILEKFNAEGLELAFPTQVHYTKQLAS